jgi:hypothetical protein
MAALRMIWRFLLDSIDRRIELGRLRAGAL